MSTPDSSAVVAPPSRIAASLSGWRLWWSELGPVRKAAPGLAVGLYWLLLLAFDRPRSDHWLIGSVVLVLAYAGAGAGRLLTFLMPVLLTGVIYDTQRYYPHLVLGEVHVVEPYLFDRHFFGIRTADGVITPTEWLQQHTHPALDLVTGGFYLSYVALFLGVAGWFQFRLSRTGTARASAATIAAQAPRLMWGFFWLNMLGYLTYHLFPAAPPWYVDAHGFGPARFDVPPSAAGCARFDDLLGTELFTAMYSRSADVFGAIPSLHVAYPLLAAWYAFRFGALRAFTVLFFVMMCFSALYLNHHYIVDILWGACYALITAVLTDWVADRRDRRVAASGG